MKKIFILIFLTFLSKNIYAQGNLYIFNDTTYDLQFQLVGFSNDCTIEVQAWDPNLTVQYIFKLPAGNSVLYEGYSSPTSIPLIPRWRIHTPTGIVGPLLSNTVETAYGGSTSWGSTKFTLHNTSTGAVVATASIGSSGTQNCHNLTSSYTNGIATASWTSLGTDTYIFFY